jgi:tRNA(Ile)-lysidine synthase
MIISKIKSIIKDHDLIRPSDHLLVGVSGGPDSVFLLNVLAKLKKEWGFRISVAHLNHCLRGKDSDKDEKFVAKTAADLQLPYYRARVDVKDFAKKNKYSVEQAARTARYNFFVNLCKVKSIKKILLAHTKDDQVETVLMRIIRGTGIKGLGAMKYNTDFENIKIIRPLLGIEKDQIIEYLKIHKIRSRVDKSNFKKDYFRNKIRLDILPRLLKLSPGLKDSIFRMALSAQDADAFVQHKLKPVYNNTVEEKRSQFQIERKKYIKLMPLMRKELLRKLINNLKGDLNAIDFKHIEIIDQFIRQDDLSGKELDLPQNIKLRKTRQNAIFTGGAKILRSKSAKVEYKLGLNKKISLKELGYEISAERVKIKPGIKRQVKLVEYLDLDKLEFPLTVRTRRPGDTFWPLGAKGKKKLKKFLIDQKIDDHKKDKLPLILSKNKIALVGFMRIGEPYKITKNSRSALKVSFRKIK